MSAIKKTRINITTMAIERTGGVRAVLEIANRLHDLNYDVTVTALAGSCSWFPLKVKINYVTSVPNKGLAKSLDMVARTYRRLRDSRRKVRYKASSLFYLSRQMEMKFGAQLDLIPYLAENIPDCDVNIATWYPTAFAVYFSGKGRPYYFLQDSPAMVAEQCSHFDAYCLNMFKATLQLPFCFLANSAYTKGLVIENQPYANVSVVGVGVDTTIFHPREKKLFDETKKPKIMVILGGFKFKGDEIAVGVLNAVNEKLPIHAILVGSDRSIENAFDFAKPRFAYTHFPPIGQDELAALYSSADLFLYTSCNESLGLPPLEAMGCCTPVITTDCLGNREYAVDNFNCLVLPSGNVRALAERTLELLTNESLAETLVRGGLETVARFTWDKVIERIDGIFRSAEKGI